MNDEPLSTEILSFVIPSKLQNVTAGSSRRRRARFHIRSLILVLHLIEKSGRDERGWSLSGSADWWDRFRPRIALWLPRRPSVRSECPSPPPPRSPRASLPSGFPLNEVSTLPPAGLRIQSPMLAGVQVAVASQVETTGNRRIQTRRPEIVGKGGGGGGGGGWQREW